MILFNPLNKLGDFKYFFKVLNGGYTYSVGEQSSPVLHLISVLRNFSNKVTNIPKKYVRRMLFFFYIYYF